MTETPTPAMLKLGAAAVGGYVLGRFKKGRAALGLGLWLAGSRTGLDPRRIVRQGLLNLLNSPEGKEVLGQLRGPVLEAGRRAAAATLESQAGSLAKALESRTAALTAAPGKAAETGEEGEEAEDEYEGDEEEEAEDEEDYEDEEPEDAPRPRKAAAQQPRKAARQPRKAAAQQPRKATGRQQRGAEDGGRDDDSRDEEQPRKRARRSSPETRTPRRPRKEGARS